MQTIVPVEGTVSVAGLRVVPCTNDLAFRVEGAGIGIQIARAQVLKHAVLNGICPSVGIKGGISRNITLGIDANGNLVWNREVRGQIRRPDVSKLPLKSLPQII